jgi:hypothetical protein
MAEERYNPYPKSAVYVHSANDVPQGEHWAIFESSSYTTEEHGVWAPGHGYPASTEHFVTYVAYTVKEEFEAEVRHRISKQEKSFYNKTFRAVHVLPVSITTTVTIS